MTENKTQSSDESATTTTPHHTHREGSQPLHLGVVSSNNKKQLKQFNTTGQRTSGRSRGSLTRECLPTNRGARVRYRSLGGTHILLLPSPGVAIPHLQRLECRTFSGHFLCRHFGFTLCVCVAPVTRRRSTGGENLHQFAIIFFPVPSVPFGPTSCTLRAGTAGAGRVM